jgi:RimJ/RimL family protein N-acetyltransferase
MRSDVVSAFATAAAELAPWSGRQIDDQTLDPLRRAVRVWRGDAVESHGPALRFGEVRAASVPDHTVVIDEANAQLLDANFPYTRTVLSERAPVVGIVRDGAVVSACYSSRRRRDAAEAGVDTIEPYRGQGFAVGVVAAWAVAARRGGLMPLYSTSWDNYASLKIAAKLGLEAYAETLPFG